MMAEEGFQHVGSVRVVVDLLVLEKMVLLHECLFPKDPGWLVDLLPAGRAHEAPECAAWCLRAVLHDIS